MLQHPVKAPAIQASNSALAFCSASCELSVTRLGYAPMSYALLHPVWPFMCSCGWAEGARLGRTVGAGSRASTARGTAEEAPHLVHHEQRVLEELGPAVEAVRVQVARVVVDHDFRRLLPVVGSHA
jgi:hypothetical protein